MTFGGLHGDAVDVQLTRTTPECSTYAANARHADLLAWAQGRAWRATALPRAGAMMGGAPTLSTGQCPMALEIEDHTNASHVLPAEAWSMVVLTGSSVET